MKNFSVLKSMWLSLALVILLFIVDSVLYMLVVILGDTLVYSSILPDKMGSDYSGVEYIGLALSIAFYRLVFFNGLICFLSYYIYFRRYNPLQSESNLTLNITIISVACLIISILLLGLLVPAVFHESVFDTQIAGNIFPILLVASIISPQLISRFLKKVVSPSS